MTAVAARPLPAVGSSAPDVSRARLDAGVRTGALVGLWAGLLLVSYWWATGGGLQSLTTWESGLLSTGRLSGLLASDLLLVQVLLMSRLPVLELPSYCH